MSGYTKALAALPGRPQLEGRLDYGPGPLSPVWPKAPELPTPRNEWEAMSWQLSGLRSACWASLRPDAGTAPHMLSFDERNELDDDLARIKAANAALSPGWHMRDVAAWPDPVLPRGVLFGARDLAAFLGEAIHAADKLSRHTILDVPSLLCKF
jgi:hypothetical protein